MIYSDFFYTRKLRKDTIVVSQDIDREEFMNRFKSYKAGELLESDYDDMSEGLCVNCGEPIVYMGRFKELRKIIPSGRVWKPEVAFWVHQSNGKSYCIDALSKTQIMLKKLQDYDLSKGAYPPD